MALGTIISFGSAMLNIAKKLAPDNDEIKGAKDIVDVLGSAYNVLNTSSVSQSAGRIMVSPVVIIQRDIIHADWANDLITIVNLLDIRDTLAHLRMQSKIGGIRIAELVDQINPNRAGFLSLRGAESFQQPNIAFVNSNKKDKEDKKEEKNPKEDPKITGFSSKKEVDFSEYTPLAVGRLVTASISADGKTEDFPLIFKQNPITATSDKIYNIFSGVRDEETWNVRNLSFKYKEITLPEYLTGEDKLKEEWKRRRNDSLDYYSEMDKRASNNRMATLRTGIVSVNDIANTFIITSDLARRIEIENGVRFDSVKGIAVIRKVIKANRIIICDTESDTFRFYSLASDKVEEYSRKAIELKSKKDTNLDLNGLLNLFNRR